LQLNRQFFFVSFRVCQGQYDTELIRAWEDWDTEKGSENDHPKIFSDKQVQLNCQSFLLFFSYLPCVMLLDADTNPSGAIPTSLLLDLENYFIWSLVVLLINVCCWQPMPIRFDVGFLPLICCF
jgi:hypothetical protein